MGQQIWVSQLGHGSVPVIKLTKFQE